MWWHLHYVGRGGLPVLAISAIDIGLWDLKCKSMKTPLWIALGGHCAEVKAYAGGIDLQLSLDDLLTNPKEYKWIQSYKNESWKRVVVRRL